MCEKQEGGAEWLSEWIMCGVVWCGRDGWGCGVSIRLSSSTSINIRTRMSWRAWCWKRASISTIVSSACEWFVCQAEHTRTVGLGIHAITHQELHLAGADALHEAFLRERGRGGSGHPLLAHSVSRGCCPCCTSFPLLPVPACVYEGRMSGEWRALLAWCIGPTVQPPSSVKWSSSLALPRSLLARATTTHDGDGQPEAANPKKPRPKRQ